MSQTLSFVTFLEKYLPQLQRDDSFFEYTKASYYLFKKYNKSIFVKEYKETIQKTEPGLRNFIEFLVNHGLWNKKRLIQIINETKKKNNTVEFLLKSKNGTENNICEKINSFLQNKFESYEIKKDSDSKIGINLKGGGYYYKRNLDSDLDILLQ